VLVLVLVLALLAVGLGGGFGAADFPDTMSAAVAVPLVRFPHAGAGAGVGTGTLLALADAFGFDRSSFDFGFDCVRFATYFSFEGVAACLVRGLAVVDAVVVGFGLSFVDASLALLFEAPPLAPALFGAGLFGLELVVFAVDAAVVTVDEALVSPPVGSVFTSPLTTSDITKGLGVVVVGTLGAASVTTLTFSPPVSFVDAVVDVVAPVVVVAGVVVVGGGVVEATFVFPPGRAGKFSSAKSGALGVG